MENIGMRIFDKINLIGGGLVAALTAAFGVNWILFAAYLLLNAGDFITGWMKARITKKEQSAKGLIGIAKKVGYWILIAVSFGMSFIFIYLGDNILHIDLSITVMLGWFTLSTLLINEIRSILENLVEIGVPVPNYLISGLAIVERLINNKNTVESEDK